MSGAWSEPTAEECLARPETGGWAGTNYVLDDQIGFVLRQVSQRHAAIFAAAMGDITPMQWAVMAKLAEIGSTSQNLLGRLTAMDVATIKGVVDRLVTRGLIDTTADSADARRRLLGLTDAGRHFVAAHEAIAVSITEATLEPLEPGERQALMAILAKLR